MFVSIEVSLRPDLVDRKGEKLMSELAAKGLTGLRTIRTGRAYHIENLTNNGLRHDPGEIALMVGRELLADPVAEVYACNAPTVDALGAEVLEVARLPGVMDPVEQSVRKAVNDLGFTCGRVRTSTRYYLYGPIDPALALKLARKLIANEVIERVIPGGIHPWREDDPAPYDFTIIHVPILSSSDDDLMRISREGTLSLNLDEMKAVQAYFRKLDREPTDVELESIAQTWSEHCVHKTLKGVIEFNGETIDNLLASTIAKATRELSPDWCVSVFKDNAGVIRFTDGYDVTFKVETHNHPSALEPYGGAGTGIGGVIRDTLGTGLGAKPILNTDVFCFGPHDMPDDAVPPGALHPRKVMEGVVSGVRDYGNRMGIPTANGAVYFDPRYTGNPLVYCGSVGLIPEGMTEKASRPGDLIVVLGGRTGRDGIHGATFSSVELTHESEKVSSGAVQIGNAIEEKKVADAILAARDKGLFSCITDCGAGGLSSAVGEMGAECGALVNLEVVPLKYQGLSYTEIWISEAQERMVLAVDPANEAALRAICDLERVEMTVIGRFTNTRKLELFYRGAKVGEVEMDFLHDGVPRLLRKASWREPHSPAPAKPLGEDFGATLLALLSSPNIASKEFIIRQYDHEVQGASVLKPLVGVTDDGPGDAAVIAPLLGVQKGVVVACGMNPRYGDLNPYNMAASGIDEALRQVIAVGGDIDQAAILDNFSWGDTKDPHQLGMLVLAAKACYDYSMLFRTPFISGKDSLNNQFNTGTEVISIPPTLLISVIAILNDLKRIRSMDLKKPGNSVWVIGLTRDEMGGSHYNLAHRLKDGGTVPVVDKTLAPALFAAMAQANRRGLFAAIHDLSEGGLAVAAAECAFAGGLGMSISLDGLPADGKLDVPAMLFSESNTRWIAEVAPEHEAEVAELLNGLPAARLGEVTAEPELVVTRSGKEILRKGCAEMKAAWQGTFGRPCDTSATSREKV